MKIYIDIDQSFVWRPVKVDELHDWEKDIFNIIGLHLQDVDEEFLAKYQEIAEQYYAIQAELEDLYRKQQQLDP